MQILPAGFCRFGRHGRVGTRWVLATLVLGALLLVPGADAGRAAAGTVTPGTAPVGGVASGTASGVHVPRDEAPHAEPDEWWYFSGHLQGTDSAGHVHRYGFEYVTFQFLDAGPEPVYVGNLAISDLTRGTFEYGAQVDSYPVPRTSDRFDLHSGPWTMRGSDGTDRLAGTMGDYSLSLRLSTTKPAALEAPRGIMPFGPFGTSAYYSWTSLLARGTIIDHGVPVRVQGISWMDHQWGAFDLASGGGWDWFSIQLRDNTQYMLYFIRDAKGRVVQTVGTRVGPRGQVRHLPATAFGERVLGRWTSPHTGITYSSGWTARVPGGHLQITPMLTDQEVDVRQAQGVVYWEGSVRVTGTVDGRHVSGVGYTEINPPDQP